MKSYESISCVEAINRLLSKKFGTMISDEQYLVLIDLFSEVEVDESIKYVEFSIKRVIR